MSEQDSLAEQLHSMVNKVHCQDHRSGAVNRRTRSSRWHRRTGLAVATRRSSRCPLQAAPLPPRRGRASRGLRGSTGRYPHLRRRLLHPCLQQRGVPPVHRTARWHRLRPRLAHDHPAQPASRAAGRATPATRPEPSPAYWLAPHALRPTRLVPATGSGTSMRAGSGSTRRCCRTPRARWLAWSSRRSGSRR
jgi:hypothetical protein